MNDIRLRFPPSPTGKIHIGNMRTAIFNWLLAKKNDGSLVLRIEDTDRERSAKEFEDIIVKELNWLGIDIDEGAGIGGSYGPYRQSERIDIYEKYLHKLIDEDKAYYCYCTEAEVTEMREKAKANDEMPGYDGRCRNLTEAEIKEFEAEGREPVVRFKTPLEDREITVDDQIRGEVSFNTSVLDDFVIFKSDGMPTYNFAVVVDDALMEVTNVMRGEDHLSNTPKQILLYQALEFDLPEFAHLPLILDKNEAKLKKRSEEQTVYVGEFREKGYLPEALFNFLALLGWSPKNDQEILAKEELINNFEIEGINKSPAVFDIEKLNWMNRKYIRKADLERIVDLAIPYLQDAGFIEEQISENDYQWIKKVIEVARNRVDYLSQIPQETELFFTELEYEDKEEAIAEYQEDGVELVFDTMKTKLNQLEQFNQENISNIFDEMREELPVGARTIYHPVRLALTGKNSGIDMKHIIYILGIDEVENRLNQALELTEQ